MSFLVSGHLRLSFLIELEQWGHWCLRHWHQTKATWNIFLGLIWCYKKFRTDKCWVRVVSGVVGAPSDEEVSRDEGDAVGDRVEGLGPLGIPASKLNHLVLNGVVLVAGDDGSPLNDKIGLVTGPTKAPLSVQWAWTLITAQCYLVYKGQWSINT